VTPIDHDGKLHGGGPSVVSESIECCPHRPPGEQHVINQDHDFARQVTGDISRGLGKNGTQADVVSIERNVEESQGRRPAFDFKKDFAQALGNGNATSLQANKDHIVDSVISLNNFVSHPG
jgi:hypothetical protein